MSTTAAPNLAEPPVSDVYDPDEVLPRNSPCMEPLRPTLQPSPSPPPTLPSSSSSSPHSPGNKAFNRRRKVKPSQGDVLLISYLDGHRRETAAWIDPSTSEPEEPEDPDLREDSISLRGTSPDAPLAVGEDNRDGPGRTRGEGSENLEMALESTVEEDVGAFDLKSLAAGALAAARTVPRPGPDAGPTPPVTENDVVGGKALPGPGPAMAIHVRRMEPLKDERGVPPPMPSPYSPHSLYSPRESGATPSSYRTDMRSPTTSVRSSSHSEGLPPIQFSSPRYETNGQTLPSIRSQLGDLPPLASSQVAANGLRSPNQGYPGSPSAPMPRLPSLHSHLASPPMPPTDPYRDPLSPVYQLSPPMLSPAYQYHQANGLRQPHEYASRSPESSSSHHPGSPPSSSFDRMNIDAIQTTGNYMCKVPGCTALPFQTQYLLNSHANVHSSARPHYCPVPGCARGEGGKGFKRKNEMIRHGLVHESPGYICPFCPDRDHRYPRPDNLQRHVRVHHVDRDKDDPLLRDVLAQRPDGPSRGRRRRGGTG